MIPPAPEGSMLRTTQGRKGWCPPMGGALKTAGLRGPLPPTSTLDAPTLASAGLTRPAPFRRHAGHRNSPCTDVRERAIACSQAPRTCAPLLPAARACSVRSRSTPQLPPSFASPFVPGCSTSDHAAERRVGREGFLERMPRHPLRHDCLAQAPTEPPPPRPRTNRMGGRAGFGDPRQGFRGSPKLSMSHVG